MKPSLEAYAYRQEKIGNFLDILITIAGFNSQHYFDIPLADTSWHKSASISAHPTMADQRQEASNLLVVSPEGEHHKLPLV